MYLKEAFRYQNHLSTLFHQTISFLSDDRNTMHIVQEHLRNKACSEAENETVDMTKDRRTEYSANQMIAFLEHLATEKEKLTSAISSAKASCGIDIDAEVANNKIRQRIADVMSDLNGLKGAERTLRSSGYKFNADGNQTSYSYEVREISTIDFDRNKVKTIRKKMTDMADKASMEIDRVMVEVCVEYEAKYDLGCTFDDAMEIFIRQE